MRSFAFPLTILLLLVALGCGGSDDDTLVISMGESSKLELCQEFRATVCAVPDFDWSGCDCDFCAEPGAVDLIDGECGTSGATAADVRDCADAFAEEDMETAYEVCLQGGGCMFDVGDASCSPSL